MRTKIISAVMILRKKSKTAIEPLVTGAKAYLLAKSHQPKPAGNNGVSYSLRGNGSGDHYDVQLLRSTMARPITDASAGEVLSALERIQNDSFGRKLLDHIAASGLRPARVYKAAGVDRRLYSRITTDFLYKPSKDTCVAFAIALRLSLEDAADLLSRAGYLLSHSNKRDLILEYLIMERVGDLITVNTVLEQLGEKILGR